MKLGALLKKLRFRSVQVEGKTTDNVDGMATMANFDGMHGAGPESAPTNYVSAGWAQDKPKH